MKKTSLVQNKALGLLAALLTVSIWASFLIGTRFAVEGNFTVEEVLILRLVPGAIALSPLMLKFDLIPRGQSWLSALILMIGASALFPYIVSSGLVYAPASDGGALAPGILPFWTALAVFFITKERPNRFRTFGLVLILTGALVVSLWDIFFNSSNDSWKGHLRFLAGSGLFAIYSVIFRQSGLSPLHSLVIGLFWGTLFIVPLLLWSGNVSFSQSNPLEIMLMIILQSFIIGVSATFLYNFAVQQLGAAEAGAFGALTPILALIGGVMLLGELFEPIKVTGIIIVALGVLLASGLIGSSSN